MKKYICEGLAEYLAKDMAPWHMPGHKRKNCIERNIEAEEAIIDGEKFENVHNHNHIAEALGLAYMMDVTEVSGTDDLHHPEEMILSSQQELAKVYGTEASYYMVNGSTGGILAAVGAVADQARGRLQNQSTGQAEPEAQNQLTGQDSSNQQIIIARNCHKSVFNAVTLFDLEPIYVEPEYVRIKKSAEGTLTRGNGLASQQVSENIDDSGSRSHIPGGITPQQVAAMVEAHPDVAAVVITSPTYEGIVSDVAGIKKVLEPYNIPLIVDEAHGAHLPFIEQLPESAVSCGGDIVVQSLHKTLPALTQTAILHVNNPQFIDGVKKYLSVFMSSSPSYVMLCSMESAVATVEEMARSERGFEEYISNLKEFRAKCGSLTNLSLLQIADDATVNDETEVTNEITIGEKKLVANQSLDDDKKWKDDSENTLCSSYTQDISRLVFMVNKEDTFITGQQLQDVLRQCGGVETEMSGVDYVVLISTFADTGEDFEKLYKALRLVDEMIGANQVGVCGDPNAENADIEALRDLVGTKATTNIYVYPPGSYIVAAGETITQVAVDALVELAESGKRIYGIS